MNYLILDTETTIVPSVKLGDKTPQLVYNIAWVIMSKSGQIKTQKSFVVKEVWEKYQSYIFPRQGEFMISQKAKQGLYTKQLTDGTTKIANFKDILQELRRDLIEGSVNTINAYNVRFDKYVLQDMQSLLGITEIFNVANMIQLLNEYVPVYNIQHGFVQVAPVKYQKFCVQNGFITKTGYMYQTKAETAYRFLSKNPFFSESHTALEDCYIEACILAYILQKKINPFPEEKLVNFPVYLRADSLTKKERVILITKLSQYLNDNPAKSYINRCQQALNIINSIQ